jgi:uncharacterized protein (DUF2345 family)
VPNIDDLDLDDVAFPHGTLLRQEEVARVIRAAEPSAQERAKAAEDAQAALAEKRRQDEQDAKDFEEFKRNRHQQPENNPDTTKVPEAVWSAPHGN